MPTFAVPEKPAMRMPLNCLLPSIFIVTGVSAVHVAESEVSEKPPEPSLCDLQKIYQEVVG